MLPARCNSGNRKSTWTHILRNTVGRRVHLPCWSGVGGISTGSGSEQVTRTGPSKFITASLTKSPKTHRSLSEGLSRGWVGMWMSTWRRSAERDAEGLMETRRSSRGRKMWREEPSELHFTSQLYWLQWDKETSVCWCQTERERECFLCLGMSDRIRLGVTE